MQGSFARKITYLRLSVTQQCDLACRYCRKGGEARGEELPWPALLRLASCAVQAGIDTVRLTGGEPLLREGCVDFLQELRPSVKRLGLTTNGTHLAAYASALAAAGINSVNVSLDTLDRKRFSEWTGRDLLPQVLEGIDEALKYRLPLKLNCVLLDDLTAAETEEFLSYAGSRALPLRFIELLPLAANDGRSGPTGELLRQRLTSLGYRLRPLENVFFGKGPARYYEVKKGDFTSCIGLIEALSNNFCSSCDRLRLDCRGRLYGCLYHRQHADLGELLAQGAEDEELVARIKKVSATKPRGHDFAAEPAPFSLAEVGG